jgi:hypothetical protein
VAFWVVWGWDALIALVALYFFFVGLADGSVSSFNGGLWLMILLALGAVVGGSLWLRSAGRRRTAMSLMLILAVPGLLAALFFLIVIVAAPNWH